MPDAVSRLDVPAHSSAAAAIRDLSQRFRQAGLPTPDRDALLLVLDACGLSHEAYVLDPHRSLSQDASEAIAASCARRLGREPVSRILGRREFWGRSFVIDASTLDPRPETETLVEAVLGLIDADGRRNDPLKILDLGTGTGCILLSLIAELPQAWGIGVDIDPAALAIAARNAGTHGLATRAAFCCADWTAPLVGNYDVIVTNPPYIRHADIDGLDPEVSRYDPRGALDGGPEGYEAYHRIARQTLRLAKPGTLLGLEVGAGQTPQLIDLLINSGWGGESPSCRVFADLAGHDRVVAVRKQQ